MSASLHFVGVALAALAGLVVGNVLNHWVTQMPLLLQARWRAECRDYLGLPTADAQQQAGADIDTMQTKPCSASNQGWLAHLPLLGWWLLRRRCAAAEQPLSWRYPLLELLTGLMFALLYGLGGISVNTLLWAGCLTAWLTLACMDWETTLLPDAIVLPLLWAGLLAASLGWSGTALHDAVWGAALGYGMLWSVYQLYKWWSGKEGMGHGDFKLLAAMGAWLGWPALFTVLMVASISGALVGVWLMWRGRLTRGQYLPFGPFLVLGGVVACGLRWTAHGVFAIGML